MEDKYSIIDIENMSVDELRDFALQFSPPNEHRWMHLSQLKLYVIMLLNSRGQLKQQDADIVNMPLFGKIYINEGGDLQKSLIILGVEMLPGMTVLSIID